MTWINHADRFEKVFIFIFLNFLVWSFSSKREFFTVVAKTFLPISDLEIDDTINLDSLGEKRPAINNLNLAL